MNQDNFVVKLMVILVGYTSVLLPFYCLIQYVDRKCKENDKSFLNNSKLWRKILKSFAVGYPECLLLTVPNSSLQSSNLQGSDDDGKNLLISAYATNFNQQKITIKKSYKRSFFKDWIRISVYFFGIQVTLVTMGFFQERIITQGYLLIENPLISEKFDDAQFLVFANRIVGCLLSGAYLFYDWKRQPIHIPPLCTHSLTSISNTISSWCQYEALKYVSFPTQTVCKASKVIPTMLMGRLLRKERYPYSQYGFALLLVFGASLFFLSINNKESLHSDSTKISGLVLMAGYLALDAFTPNYQKKLMEARVSCCQMMFYVNAFSAFFCFVSLMQQFTFFSTLSFIMTHYGFFYDCFFLSLGSACGQIFIYLTIDKFGPVALSVMMTLRQIFSIILSAFYFNHPISNSGLFGLLLVFGSILADTYRKYWCRTASNNRL